jgi:PadR family transcriptional regulator PadR
VKTDDYHEQLLTGWEEVYKKGQLTLWIMLALKEGPKRMQGIKAFIAMATERNLSVDDKSMYRALRRYVETEMLDYTTEPNKLGPDHKLYALTPVGAKVAEDFLARNIRIFYKPAIKNIITRS